MNIHWVGWETVRHLQDKIATLEARVDRLYKVLEIGDEKKKEDKG